MYNLSYSLFFYHQCLPCLWGYFVGVADAVVDDPDDVVAGAEEPCVFFFDLGEFLVGEKVAEFFVSGHAERDEGVAGFWFSDGQWKLDFFAVETDAVSLVGDGELVVADDVFYC